MHNKETGGENEYPENAVLFLQFYYFSAVTSKTLSFILTAGPLYQGAGLWDILRSI